jgi:hypothetical protein
MTQDENTFYSLECAFKKDNGFPQKTGPDKCNVASF